VGTVTVTLPATTLQVGATLSSSAEVRSTAGAVLTGRTVSWTSSSPSTASVSDGGVITGVAPGTVTVTATSDGKTGSASLTVVLAPVNAVAVTAPASTLVTERTLQATAILRDERGATLSGRTVAWTTSTPAVATVNDAGLVTGVSAGSVTITATSEGKSGTLVLSVVPPPVNSMSLALAQSTVPQGGTTTATVQLRDDRNVLLTGRTVTFASSDPAVATVTNAGVITAVAVGNTTITASSEGKSAAAALTVIRPPVANVTVTLTPSVLAPGATSQAQVALRDAAGRTLTGRTVTFGTTNPAVATVNATGAVTAVSPGIAIVTASSEGQTGQATVQVLVPVASVVFNGSTRVKVGDSYNYTVTARAADGTILDRQVLFRVRETARAQMTTSGVLTPLQAGTITMVALIDGVEWDASYTAYDWEYFTSNGDGFLSIESDARVANRFGTLQYTELVMACGPSSRFFLWVRVPHMITSNGLVAYSFDTGAPFTQTWTELSPSFNSLWAPGSSGAVKTFAQIVATARRFFFAFTEFNSVARAMTFRVTGLSDRLPSLLALCPANLKQLPQSDVVSEPLDVRASLAQAAAKRSSRADTLAEDDVAARRASVPAAGISPLLTNWPTWQTPESTTARRVRR
jgi:uncharacterized protein YjdB